METCGNLWWLGTIFRKPHFRFSPTSFFAPWLQWDSAGLRRPRDIRTTSGSSSGGSSSQYSTPNCQPQRRTHGTPGSVFSKNVGKTSGHDAPSSNQYIHSYNYVCLYIYMYYIIIIIIKIITLIIIRIKIIILYIYINIISYFKLCVCVYIYIYLGRGTKASIPSTPIFSPGIFHPQTFQHILFTHRL